MASAYLMQEMPRPHTVRRGPSRRVLVVEDNPDGRTALQMLLESWGHEVQCAEDGAQALGKGLSWGPDVVVLDIGLPVYDGFYVARRFREELGDRVRLIALTAFCRSEDRRRVIEAGFDAYMAKPADFDRLRRLVALPV